MNQIGSNEFMELNKRVISNFEPDIDSRELYITLATRKDTVDYINERNLKKLEDKLYCYEGKIEGEFNENNLPTSQMLELKENAQVMFIKNDPERRWVNGSLGRIIHLDDDEIGVLLEDGEQVLVDKAVWRNIKYEYNEKEKKIEEKELGNFVQYPLRLAWAVTIHKSQGLTFDNVIIDMGEGAFAAGQTYVALSRCTSLEGIVLKNPLRQRDVFVKKEVADFAQKFNDQQAIKGSLEKAEAIKLYLQALELFNQMDFQGALNCFFKAQSLNDLSGSPVYRRFIAFKFAQLGRYKAKFKQEVVSKINLMADFKDMANEFYAMGNECATKYKDNKSAIANYNKAIKLNPLFYDAIIRRGVTNMQMQKYKEAEGDFSDAIRLKVREFKAYYNRGKLYMQLKSYEAAIDDLKEAIVLNNNSRPAYKLLAEAYSKVGEPEKAAEIWGRMENL